MTTSLYPQTDEQEMLVAAVRTLARERIAPRAAEVDHSAEFPWDAVELLREHEVFALPFPSRARRHRDGIPDPPACGRGALLGRCQCRPDPRRPGARRPPRSARRERRAARRVRPPLGERRVDRRLRTDRARRRLGCPGADQPRRPGRLGLGAGREQALHHQRRRRHDLRGVRALGRRHQRIPRARRRSRVPGRADRAQDGDQGIDHRRAPAGPLPHPGRPPDRRGRGRLPTGDAGARPLPPRDRRAGPGHRPGCPRLLGALRDRAGRIRQADRRPAGPAVHAGRHGDRGRGLARAPLPRRARCSMPEPQGRS